MTLFSREDAPSKAVDDEATAPASAECMQEIKQILAQRETTRYSSARPLDSTLRWTICLILQPIQPCCLTDPSCTMAPAVMLRVAQNSIPTIRAAQWQSPNALLFWDSACMYELLKPSVAKIMVAQLQSPDLWDCSPINKMTITLQPCHIQTLLLSKSPVLQVSANSMLLLLVHDLRDRALQVPDLWLQPTQQKRQPFGDHVQPLQAQTSARSLHWLPHRDLLRQPSRSRLSVLPCSILLF